MNAAVFTYAQHDRDAVLEELARVLRNPNAVLTNIESAIASTRFSLRHVRACFGGTRELMLAMAAFPSDGMTNSLDHSSPARTVRQRLLQFAQRLLELQATSHMHSLYRIAVTEAIRRTDAADCLEVWMRQLTRYLADFLRTAQIEGALAPGDPYILAGHFISPLRANLYDGEPLSRRLAESRAARDAYAQNVVHLFCRGVTGSNHAETLPP